jgi:rRNA-processing protein FCF1|tara:strand:+ start:929 stop:1297 length:369 start_codon:yes stop_codon:yes gene_type:complete
MVGVLVDACGWVALMDAKLNIDDAMKGVVGQAELMVLESVHRELDLLSQQRKGLLLGLLESRSERVLDLDGMSHPDEMLVTLSGSRRWPVLTVDRDLKERLISSGGSYIEVASGRFLRLVET